MTIQVGHPHECPTFFCAPPQGEVNESTSLCPIGRISPIRPMPPNAKAPFLLFFAKYMRHLRQISIIISVRYNLTDRKNRPFGLFFWFGFGYNKKWGGSCVF